MNEVWYSAHREARGKRHVTRHESDGEQTFSSQLQLGKLNQHDYDWGRGSLGCAQLAADLVADALDLRPDEFEHSWVFFQTEVINRLPLEGWELTQEAIIDWWLGGISCREVSDFYHVAPNGEVL